MPSKTSKEPLTLKQRAAKAVSSQGRAIADLEKYSEANIAKLAKLCDAGGLVVKDAPQKFSEIQRAHLDSKKATTDDADMEGDN